MTPIRPLRRLLWLACIAAMPLSSAHAEDAIMAGTVTQIRGAAFANHRTTSDNLSRGMTVSTGDRIVTGHDSRVELRMTDGAILTLGADTEFAINDYRYSRQARQGSARLELFRGAFRAITGAIGKLEGRDFKVRTAAGTIGIRGTDFWGGFYFSQALDVALLGGGGIYVENAAGRVTLTEAGSGTTIQDSDTPPSAPIHWGERKLNAAQQSVSWE
jgi:hypothetical protein